MRSVEPRSCSVIAFVGDQQLRTITIRTIPTTSLRFHPTVQIAERRKQEWISADVGSRQALAHSGSWIPTAFRIRDRRYRDSLRRRRMRSATQRSCVDRSSGVISIRRRCDRICPLRHPRTDETRPSRPLRGARSAEPVVTASSCSVSRASAAPAARPKAWRDRAPGQRGARSEAASRVQSRADCAPARLR